MGARVYAPVPGRFLAVDPIEGGVDNNYVYPQDPVNKYDLKREYIETALDVAGFAYDYNQFKKSRSLKNAGWMALDLIGIALPIVPSAGGFRAAANGLKYSDHALQRMGQRGVTKKMVQQTFTSGRKYYDTLHRNSAYVLRIRGAYLRIAVENGQLVRTVIYPIKRFKAGKRFR